MTNGSPHITIIIPTFRAAKTLRATLDSVLCQDFRDFEVLVMDGGSDDGTAAIVQQAADDRIRFVSERDKGVYDAMNKGITAARGVWLYFLGADDLLYGPGVLSSIFGAGGNEDADLLYGDVVSPSYKGRYDGPFDFAKLLSRNISHQAIFYRRSLFDRFAGYNLGYPGYADWDLNIRIFASAGVRLRYIDAIIARFGPDGISSRHDSAFLREVLFPNKLQLIKEKGMKELRPLMAYDEVWRLLRNGEFSGARSLSAGPAANQTTPAASATTPANPAEVPVAIRQMAAWQEHIPRRFLRIGALSKTIMLTSYLRHLLSGALH